ncbi:MAG: ChaN family lipoprotein [Nitrospira sp.]
MIARLTGLPVLRAWLTTLLVVLLSIFICSTSSLADGEKAPQTELDTDWQPWHILETRTGRTLPFAEWLKTLEQHDIIYLGEEHHNSFHIQAALKVLDQLITDGIEPTIGLEMFGWDGQQALDEYVAGPKPVTDEFLEQVRWKQNWGGAFEDYAPLVIFARDHHLSVRAMNPPKPLIRRVVQVGLEQAKQQPEWTTWGILQDEIVDDPAYRERIVDQLTRCHGGTEDHYRTMYEASMVRDEGMAKTLVTRQKELRRDPSEPRRIIVSYTGGGHIQYNLPVPKRVARRMGEDIKQTTVYMMSFDTNKVNDVRSHLQDPIADYVWLTPVGKADPAKPCR